jgi:hypothetical protein
MGLISVKKGKGFWDLHGRGQDILPSGVRRAKPVSAMPNCINFNGYQRLLKIVE